MTNIGVGRLNKDKFVAPIVLLLLFSTVLIAFSGPTDTAHVPAQTLITDPIDDMTPTEEQIVISPELGAYFTENLGQLGDIPWRYYAIGQGLSVAFGDGMFAYRLTKDGTGGSLVTVHLVGAEDARPDGKGILGHPTNYLIGNDPDKWIQGAMSYTEVLYKDAWGGIDLRFSIVKGQLKYEFEVPPGDDTSLIKFRYEGIDGLEIDRSTGALDIKTTVGTLVDAPPISVQNIDGERILVKTQYHIGKDGTLAFLLGPYNRSKTLVIDPGMTFSTLIGGTKNENVVGMDIDDQGNIYLCGMSQSSDFPTTPGAFDTTANGSQDAVVFKLNSNGSKLLYSTFIGGSNSDAAKDIVVDGSSNVYVTGYTSSTGFPTTPGVIDRTKDGAEDVFCLKLNSTGSSLIFSTLFGGSVRVGEYGERGNALWLDSQGNVYIAGATDCSDFPTTTGAFDTSPNGNKDAFLVKINSNASAIIFSTLLGGSRIDVINDLWVDDSGHTYVTGWTQGYGFPVTIGAYNNSYYGIFVTKVNASGDILLYSANIGQGTGLRISVDNIGQTYVFGTTSSGIFPTTIGAYDTSINGGQDAFVFKLNSNGTNLEFSTLIGGSDHDANMASGGLWVDDSGHIFILLRTVSSDFPVSSDAADKVINGTEDAILAKFNPNASKLLYSTYIGGSGIERPHGLYLDNYGCAIIIGETDSTDYPTTPNAYCSTLSGGRDIFVTKFDFNYPFFGEDRSSRNATTGDPFLFNISVGDNLAVSNVTVEYWYDNTTNTTNMTLSLSSGSYWNGTWAGTIEVASDSVDPLFYRFWANDSSSNINITATKRVEVIDNDAPSLVDQTAMTPTTGDPFTLSANATDNIGIYGVHFIYWYEGQPGTKYNLSMTGQNLTSIGNGLYQIGLSIASHINDSLVYYFAANDTFNNWNRTANITLDVIDDDHVTFIQDLSDSIATTGDTITFRVQVADNIGIDSVDVVYWSGRLGTHMITMVGTNVSASGNGTYEYGGFSIPPHSLAPLNYYFIAMDTSRNGNSTPSIQLTVMDNDVPLFLSDMSDEHASTGDPFEFSTEVLDNIDIKDVWVVYWFGGDPLNTTNVSMIGTDVTGLGNGTYALGTLVIHSDSIASLSYHFVVSDSAGNMNSTSTKTVVPHDDDAPEFGHDGSDTDPVKGLEFGFSINVSDNIGTSGVYLVYWYGEGTRSNITLEGQDIYGTTVVVPRPTTSDLFYYFTAVDAEGNWNLTEIVRITPVNLPPVILELPVWSISEETSDSFDISGYVTDANDPSSSMILVCSAPNITVSGLTLQGLYEVWVPDHLIEISISDGEDTVFANISVTIVNVNDVPIITSSPGLVASVNVTYTYQLVFEDEDPFDEHTYYIIAPGGMSFSDSGVLEWTPSRDQHDLHHVNVTIFDGTVNVSQTWSISVNVSEDDPGNRPPRFLGSPRLNATAGELYRWDAHAEDPDGDRLFFHLVEGPEGASIHNQTGVLTWMPSYAKADITIDVPFQISIKDGVHTVSLPFIVRLRYPADQPPEIQGTIADVNITKEHSVNLAQYMYDPDDPVSNLTWKLEGGDEALFTVMMDGNSLVLMPREDADGSADLILILEDPSGLSDSQTLTVRVEPKSAEDISGTFPWWILLLIIALVVVVAFAMMARGRTRGPEEAPDEEHEAVGDEETVEVELEDAVEAPAAPIVAPIAAPVAKEDLSYIVEQVFVVYRDGRLVVECAREECRTRDADLMSGMLIAIQGLIQDGLESGGTLKSINYGDNLIRMAQGEHVVLAAVIYGEPDAALMEDLDATVSTIEGSYAGVIENWNGDLDQLSGISHLVDPLLHRTAHLGREDIEVGGTAEGISMLSAVDFYRGYVRLKAAAVNSTEELIAKATFEVTYDNELLRMERVEPETLQVRGDKVMMGTIMPGERRTVAFLFDPQICQETYLDGHMQYYDTRGEVHHVQMKRRQATVVCPVFFTKENANTAMLRRLISDKLHQSDLRVFRYPEGLPPKDALSVGRAALGGDIQKVSEYTLEGPPYESEVWYYAETKVKGYQMVIRMAVLEEKGVLEFFCASTAMEPITGLLAEFRRELNHVLRERYTEEGEMEVERDEGVRRELQGRSLLIDRVGEGEIEPEDA